MGANFGKESKKEINESYVKLLQNNKQEKLLELNINHELDQNKNKLEIKNYCNSYVSGKYKRDSFDRFGDDLCELILSYLYLNEKIRFECVNRQWNHCLYNRVFEINYPLETWNFYFLYNPFNDKQKDLILKKLIKKCKNLKRLKISKVYNKKFLRLVLQNCKFLEEIFIRFDNYKPIKREIMSAFAMNIGQRLKRIKILELSEKHFNSETGLSLLMQTSKTAFSEYFPKLREIELSLDSDNCLKQFILFTDIYEQRIKSLKLRLKFSPKYKEVNQTFEQISRFHKLRKLSLILESVGRFELNFSELLKILFNIWLEIRNIDIKIEYGIFSSTPILETLEPVIDLNSIKVYINTYDIQLGSISSLIKFKNLTELYIKDQNLTDEAVNNIYYYCPKLESIALLACNELTDNSLYCLSKISNLKKISISGFHMNGITDSGVISLFNNCQNLRIIDFDCEINITELTFSTLNVMAKSSPQRRFFSFCYDISNLINTMTFPWPSPSELWPEIKSAPENLKLICKLNDNNIDYL